MKTVLVLGANGRFGRAAVDAFAAAGWTALAQLRRAPATPLPRGARAVEAPLADASELARRAAGASVVVYAVNPLYTRWEEELFPLFHQGVAVARALDAVFMLPGNVYNYGQHAMSLHLNEQAPDRPGTRKGEMRVAMEDELRALATAGLDSVVIRAGDFFGCGTGSYLDLAIVKDIARGRIVYPGPLDVPHAWTYLPDLARAFVAVAAHGRVAGMRRFHFGGHTLTGHELIGALDRAAAGLGLRPERGFRIRRMHWGLLRVLGLVNPMLRELTRMSYLWRVPHGMAGDALTRAVGPVPPTPIEEALRQSLIDLGLAPALRALSLSIDRPARNAG